MLGIKGLVLLVGHWPFWVLTAHSNVDLVVEHLDIRTGADVDLILVTHWPHMPVLLFLVEVQLLDGLGCTNWTEETPTHRKRVKDRKWAMGKEGTEESWWLR